MSVISAAASALKLLALTALLTEAAARIGAGILPLIGRGRPAGWESLSLGLFLGWGAAGTALLGLALAGLFYPGVIIACCLVLLAASPAFRIRRVFLLEGVKPLAELDPVRGGLLMLAGVYLVAALMPGLLLPDLHADTLTYHLGAPWQYLQTHGIQLWQVSWTFHYPMPVEMAFSIPIVLGDDRLARWITLTLFLGAVLFFLGQCLRRGEKDAAWLGIYIALATAQVLPLATSCKSDMAAAALFVVGALLSLAGSRLLSALFLGMCAAAKPTIAPLAAIWFLFRPPPVRLIVPALTALMLPSLPWLFKTYWATGNPLGLAASWLPSYDWGPANEYALRTFGHLGGEGTALSNLPPAWFESLCKENLLVFLLLPGTLFLGRWRMAALACVLAQLVTLKFRLESRYIFGSIWLLGLLAGRDICILSPRVRLLALALLGLASGAWMADRFDNRGEKWRDLKLPVAEYRRKNLTTFERTLDYLKTLNPARTLTLGEFKTYRFPGRVLFGGTLGETPVAWKIVHESEDIRRLAIKFRQLGAQYVWHNYVTSDLTAFHYAEFPWNLRMIRLYVEYLKRHQFIVRESQGSDYVNGGFYIYGVSRRPVASPKDNVWFVPGAELIFAPIELSEKKYGINRAIEVGLAIKNLIPDVGSAWNAVGRCYLRNNMPKEAFQMLRPFVEAGMVDALNLADYVSAARLLGKIDLAESMANRCLSMLPDHRSILYVELAIINVIRANKEINEGDGMRLQEYIEKVERYIAMAGDDPKNRGLSRKVLATAKSYSAIHSAMVGKVPEALRLLEEACETDPDNKMVREWRRLAEELRRKAAPAERK